MENIPVKTTSRSHMITSRSPLKESRVEPVRDPSRDRHRDSPQKSSSSYYSLDLVVTELIRKLEGGQGINLIAMGLRRKTTLTRINRDIGKIPILNQLQVNATLL